MLSRSIEEEVPKLGPLCRLFVVTESAVAWKDQTTLRLQLLLSFSWWLWREGGFGQS